MDVELKYTWRISRRKWYIRFFRWLWKVPEREVTFCKIFWGYAFAWLMLPVRLAVITTTFAARAGIWTAGQVAGIAKDLSDFVRWACRMIAKTTRWMVFGDREPRTVIARPFLRATKPVKRSGDLLASGARDARDFVAESSKTVGTAAARVMPQPHVPSVSVRVPAPSLPKRPTVKCPRVRIPRPNGTRLLAVIEFAAAWASLQMSRVRYAVRDVRKAARKKIVAPVIDALALVLVGFVEALGFLTMRVAWPPLRAALCVLEMAVHVVVVSTAVLLDLAEDAIDRYADAALLGLFVAGCIAVAGGLAFGIYELVLASWWTHVPHALATVGPMLGTAGIETGKALAGVAVEMWKVAPLFFLLMGIVLGAAAVCLGLAFLYAYVLAKYFAPALYRRVVVPTHHGAKATARGLKSGSVGFGKVMLIGIKAVKSNTCPRIEIEE